MQTLQQKAFVSGTAVQAKTRVAAKSVRSPVVVRAQKEEVRLNELKALFLLLYLIFGCPEFPPRYVAIGERLKRLESKCLNLFLITKLFVR